MGEEKWLHRKPGRASGTVVPPPVADDPPPLPERRRPGGTRQRPDGLPDAQKQPPTPEMPDNVRLLFRPVLRPGEGRPGKDRRREPNFKPIRSQEEMGVGDRLAATVSPATVSPATVSPATVSPATV